MVVVTAVLVVVGATVVVVAAVVVVGATVVVVGVVVVVVVVGVPVTVNEGPSPVFPDAVTVTQNAAPEGAAREGTAVAMTELFALKLTASGFELSLSKK